MKKFHLIIIILLIGNICLLAERIKRGVRISYSVTAEQIAFADSAFDYLMTPFLSEYVRNSVTHAKLLLYRSILGTKENTTQWDWNFIVQHENMFCHSDSAVQDESTRIITKWEKFLMNGMDFVEPTSQDAASHWCNYYAVAASTQVNDNNYDGLFIDSASHLLKQSMLAEGESMPWDYDQLEWRLARYATLELTKSYLQDKIVIFNGLHNGAGADSSLAVTDGGMWEDFAYNPDNGEYKGAGKWKKAIDCMQENRENSRLVLVVKKPGLIDDIQARIFSVGSYLLIENENTILTLSDYDYDTTFQYYPEFDIDLGEPLGDFIQNDDTLFTREFTNGLVVVNPLSTSTKTFTLNREYHKIIPVGGGFVDDDGGWTGNLTYENISAGEISLPPVSALILKDSITTDVNNDLGKEKDFRLSQNYPNPFNPTTIINYVIPSIQRRDAINRVSTIDNNDEAVQVSLKVYDALGREIATIVNAKQTPGKYSVQFNARSASGGLPSGVYFYTLRAGNFVQTRKMILLR